MANNYDFQKAWRHEGKTFILATYNEQKYVFETQGDFLVQSLLFADGQAPEGAEEIGASGVVSFNGKPCLTETRFKGYSRLFNTGKLTVTIVRTRTRVVQPVANP